MGRKRSRAINRTNKRKIRRGSRGLKNEEDEGSSSPRTDEVTRAREALYGESNVAVSLGSIRTARAVSPSAIGHSKT